MAEYRRLSSLVVHPISLLQAKPHQVKQYAVEQQIPVASQEQMKEQSAQLSRHLAAVLAKN